MDNHKPTNIFIIEALFSQKDRKLIFLDNLVNRVKFANKKFNPDNSPLLKHSARKVEKYDERAMFDISTFVKIELENSLDKLLILVTKLFVILSLEKC